MKFDTALAPPEPAEAELVGNVYRCKGGNKTKYWIIVGVHKGTAICLGVDHDGDITSSTNYGIHVFEGYPYSRELLGRVIEMPEMSFRIAWGAR